MTTECQLGPAPLGAARGLLCGWLALALVNAVTLQALFPLLEGPPSLALLTHAYDTGHVLAVGLAVTAVVGAWVRWGPRHFAYRGAGVAVISVAVTASVARDDLIGLAQSTLLIDAFELWWGALVVGLGLALAGALSVGRWLARRHAAFAIAIGASGLAAAIANHVVLENLYSGIHALVSGVSAVTMGIAFATVPVPRQARRWFERPSVRAAAWAVAAIAVVGAGLTIVIRPPSAVLLTLLRLPGAPVVGSQAVWTSSLEGWPGEEVTPVLLPSGWGPWFVDRSQLPDIPPTRPAIVRPDAIVVLMVVDAMRSDLLTKHADRLPHMKRMRDEGVYFRHAYAPSSGTSQTMSAVFTGKYHTMLEWAAKRTGKRIKYWPHLDDSVRVLELLSAADVLTLNATPHDGFRPEYGITRGMSRSLEPPERWAPSQIAVTVDGLSRIGPEPAFVYMHFDEAHSPYNRAGREGPPFERYLREVELIDRALEPLFDLLAERPDLAARTVLVLTADHGEAFGEHNSRYHAKTVYEEAVRVPFIVHAPASIAASEIDLPVSLIDLGPTLLDLFGVPTPGAFVGQSLVPLIGGRSRELDRPIVFDTTGHALGMLFPDGVKLVIDPAKGTRELYDLNTDPLELDDQFEARPDAPWRLEVLRWFCQVHDMQPPEYYAY